MAAQPAGRDVPLLPRNPFGVNDANELNMFGGQQVIRDNAIDRGGHELDTSVLVAASN